LSEYPASRVAGQVPKALAAEAQSSHDVALGQTGHEPAKKSSKIVPLGAPLLNLFREEHTAVSFCLFRTVIKDGH
jgi:hypothetical protein